MIVGIVVGVLVVGVLGAGAAYAALSRDRVLPGVSLAGESEVWSNPDEAVARLAERVNSQPVTITRGERRVSDTAAHLGVTLDVEATREALTRDNDSWTSRLRALFSSREVQPVIMVDERELADGVQSVLAEGLTGPVEPVVAFNAETSAFETTPGEDGEGVDVPALAKKLGECAVSFDCATVTAEVAKLPPSISAEVAEGLRARAQRMVELDLRVGDGGDGYAPDVATKASWLVLPDDPQSDPTVKVDEVAKWVTARAEEAKVEPAAGLLNVAPDGTVRAVVREGRVGRTVKNADAVAQAIAASMARSEPVTSDFEFNETKLPDEKRDIDPAALNLRYPAARGEKWIDVDINGRTATAYEGGQVVRANIPIVPGNIGTDTVRGTFKIYLKYRSQDMGCSAGWSYCIHGVPWVMYFHGSYALHGAPWRSKIEEFGPGSVGGSHGCVNLPVEIAQWMYDWAPIGTVVVTH